VSYDDEGYDNELELLPDPPADRRGRVSPTEALEEDLEVAARRDPRQPAEVEVLLQRVHDLVATARSMPMSASVMISRDEVLDLVEDVMARLPEELRAARWLLKEREDFLARTHREGDEILEAARAKAERMVQRTEVVKSAEHRARHIIDVAEADARRMQHECEDFCDQKLASFEIVLERTLKTVAAGRSKLQGNPLSGEVPVVETDEADESAQAFFDQDQS
jgi:cell division septum initiation protein DivIVA